MPTKPEKGESPLFHLRSWTTVPVPFFLALVIGCSGSEGGGTGDAGVDAAVDSGAGGQAGAGGAGGEGGAGGVAGMGGEGGASSRRIFVTDTVQNAAFGGIAGADALCVSQAAAAGLQGEFRAWLSTSSSAVADRLTRSTVPYVLVDGTRVADDWNDLVDGAIMAPIDLDANGLPRTGDVWTGTLATGASYPNDDCTGFTSASPAQIGLCGASASATSTWTENITPNCSTVLRLYCIEQ